MGSQWGNNIKLSIFGESHGEGIGIVIDGLTPGMDLDWDYINFQMARRVPGKNKFSTARKESDRVEILSGILNNKTTGAPLCAFIKNSDKKSKDYDMLQSLMRPGHSDYPANRKYKGYNDVRGGGHFSGRLTASLVFAGSLARQILDKKGIKIVGRIKSIGNIVDVDIENDLDILNCIKNIDFPAITKEKEMQTLIEKVRLDRDSVGGVIEIVALGVKAGLGNPFFDSLESTISHMIFSVPGVKGIEFGKGFEISSMLGSESNDEYYFSENEIKTYTNNNGGILGGISNGMPIVVKVAIKPTPSIGKVQKTVNITTSKNSEVEITGRHDPCIVPRAVVVIESVMALAILDQMIGGSYE